MGKKKRPADIDQNGDDIMGTNMVTYHQRAKRFSMHNWSSTTGSGSSATNPHLYSPYIGSPGIINGPLQVSPMRPFCHSGCQSASHISQPHTISTIGKNVIDVNCPRNRNVSEDFCVTPLATPDQQTAVKTVTRTTKVTNALDTGYHSRSHVSRQHGFKMMGKPAIDQQRADHPLFQRAISTDNPTIPSLTHDSRNCNVSTGFNVDHLVTVGPQIDGKPGARPIRGSHVFRQHKLYMMGKPAIAQERSDQPLFQNATSIENSTDPSLTPDSRKRPARSKAKCTKKGSTSVTSSSSRTNLGTSDQPHTSLNGYNVRIPGQRSVFTPISEQSCSTFNASVYTEDAPMEYMDIGDCCQKCIHCNALFWLEERLKGSGSKTRPLYNGCCSGGRVRLPLETDPPEYLRNILSNRSFLENIRAYNQMFSMTSFGAKIDDGINNGRGPYIFKLSGQVYHWLGSLCPVDGDCPRFLQLYIHDTQNEVENRLHHFSQDGGKSVLDAAVVQSLIELLDTHNKLVRLFRTARDKCLADDIPDFQITLYSRPRVRRYDLPTSNCLGAIVFDSGDTTCSDYDVIVESRNDKPQRINKLHPCYMSLQFPLLFIYGQHGYHTDLKIRKSLSGNQFKRMTMNDYYSYQLHSRHNSFNLIFRCGCLFQQYLVAVYCCIEQNRIDYLRVNQNDIRREYLSGLYDAISRGDREGNDVGSRVILPSSFTGGPRYMYSHYLDALAICRVLGNPQFFITFTCNVHWPEIRRYMSSFPELAPNDRADIISRVFEQKVQQFVKFLQEK